MSNSLKTIEVKAFVPAKDFELSKRFYQDFGFEMAWGDESLAYFRRGASVFLLQNFYEETHATNFMMHLLVDDADAWWRHIRDRNLATTYGVRAGPPEDRPWGQREFILFDPTGVLWRVGHILRPNPGAEE